jgi:hypothetical protein
VEKSIPNRDKKATLNNGGQVQGAQVSSQHWLGLLAQNQLIKIAIIPSISGYKNEKSLFCSCIDSK